MPVTTNQILGYSLEAQKKVIQNIKFENQKKKLTYSEKYLS